MYLDIIATVLTFIGIHLCSKKHISFWGVYIVANILWSIYFIPKQEWCMILVCVVAIIMQAHGWHRWANEKR